MQNYISGKVRLRPGFEVAFPLHWSFGGALTEKNKSGILTDSVRTEAFQMSHETEARPTVSDT